MTPVTVLTIVEGPSSSAARRDPAPLSASEVTVTRVVAAVIANRHEIGRAHV
jgi:hypothetical protein